MPSFERDFPVQCTSDIKSTPESWEHARGFPLETRARHARGNCLDDGIGNFDRTIVHGMWSLE